MKCHCVRVIDPVTLTFEPQNSTTSRVYPKVIPYTKFERFIGSFLFELCCGQTDRQTDCLENPTYTDHGNNSLHICDVFCARNNLSF